MEKIKEVWAGYWGPIVAGILLFAGALTVFIIMKTSTEHFVPPRYEFPSNTSFWPKWYYRSPYFKGLEGTWPPNMFSKTRFWSPSFYTGSGLQYFLRPGIKDQNYPRFRWTRDNGTHNYLFGRIDQDHKAAMYNY